MSARILVVDDVLANVKLLEAKLMAEYFEVTTAMNGVDALEQINRTKPDIVLLDVMMPGIDGIEVCRRIKSDVATQHIPVVMVTALDQPEDRVRGLEAGADDFLTKPVNDLALFCRVKSLVRLKMLTDELRNRAAPGEEMGLTSNLQPDMNKRGNILLVDDRGNLAERMRYSLSDMHDLVGLSDPQEALLAVTANNFELIIINLDIQSFDGLRLCSQLRSLEQSRQVPILIIVDPDDQARMIKALDMGANDYLLRPIDKQELRARITTQIKRMRYTELLRNNVKQSIEMAVTDPLTGLFNRRYFESQVSLQVDHANNRDKDISLLAFDVDHFKAVNDTYGHDVGDQVLREIADRAKNSVRSIDVICRTGGEEFVIVLPETDLKVAQKIGERLRLEITKKPFCDEESKKSLDITISVGVSGLGDKGDNLNTLFKRADEALYEAKRSGRNKVVLAAA